MEFKDFAIGDSVIFNGEMCEVVELWQEGYGRIVICDVEDPVRRIVVNPEDLHF